VNDEDLFVWLGWELRDHYNAMRAACDRLGAESKPAQRLRLADDICRLADGCVDRLNRMTPLFPDA
jgi:hypothetical protein